MKDLALFCLAVLAFLGPGSCVPPEKPEAISVLGNVAQVEILSESYGGFFGGADWKTVVWLDSQKRYVVDGTPDIQIGDSAILEAYTDQKHLRIGTYYIRRW